MQIRSCICVLGVSILPLSTIFQLNFWTVPTVWSLLFLNCSNSVVFLNCSDTGNFLTVPTVWYFWTVPTVWNLLFLNCSDSVVFLNCFDTGIFLTVPTVWYFLTVPTVWYFWTVPTVVFLNCSDSVVFVVFELFRECGIVELFRQCGIFELFRQCSICCFVHFMVRLIFICSLPNINQLNDSVSLEPLVFLAFLYFLLYSTFVSTAYMGHQVVFCFGYTFMCKDRRKDNMFCLKSITGFVPLSLHEITLQTLCLLFN